MQVEHTKKDGYQGGLYLGVDGGQSHTEALVAEEDGTIIGRGLGGPSNHAEQPGGRERLRNAVTDSVEQALQTGGLPAIDGVVFDSAHFGMTGGADFKAEIISAIVQSENLTVAHDAPTALWGATVGKPGIVVIAGTGSVIYGENDYGESVQIGGLGYLFSDEGSGFWLASQVIRLAIKERDGLIAPAGLQDLVLDHFHLGGVRDVTNAYYFGKISRDDIAALARPAHEAAAMGNQVIDQQLRNGADVLAKSVAVAAKRLGLEGGFDVAGVGGMFRGELIRKYFAESLHRQIPAAVFIKPRFGPAIGALLLAFKSGGVSLDPGLLLNLDKSSKMYE